jgi:hypothetical protein
MLLEQFGLVLAPLFRTMVLSFVHWASNSTSQAGSRKHGEFSPTFAISIVLAT